jgi:hypothetical protein
MVCLRNHRIVCSAGLSLIRKVANENPLAPCRWTKTLQVIVYKPLHMLAVLKKYAWVCDCDLGTQFALTVTAAALLQRSTNQTIGGFRCERITRHPLEKDSHRTSRERWKLGRRLRHPERASGGNNTIQSKWWQSQMTSCKAISLFKPPSLSRSSRCISLQMGLGALTW